MALALYSIDGAIDEIWIVVGILITFFLIPIIMIRNSTFVQLKEAIESKNWPTVHGKITKSDYGQHGLSRNVTIIVAVVAAVVIAGVVMRRKP